MADTRPAPHGLVLLGRPARVWLGYVDGQPAAVDDDRPVYERMGLVAFELWTAWLRPAG